MYQDRWPSLIPPLLPWQWTILGFLLGIFLPTYPLLSSIVLITFSLSAPKKDAFLLFFMGVTLASSLCFYKIKHLSTRDPFQQISSPLVLKATVSQVFTYPGERASVILKNITFLKGKRWHYLQGNILWRMKNARELPLPGEKIKGKIKIKKIHLLKNPGSLDTLTYYKSQGIRYISWSKGIPKNIHFKTRPNWWWRIKYRTRKKINSLLTSFPYGGIIAALLIGDRRGVSPFQIRLLREAGLSHLIAQSGLHIGFVALLGWIMGYIPAFIKPQWYLYIPRPILCCISAMGLVGMYYFLSFPSPSMSRATIMFLCVSFLFILGHKTIIWDSLFLSLFIILLLNPFSPYQMGFQLSYLAVTGILLLTPPLLSSIIHRWKIKGISLYLSSLLLMSISANLFILPILIWKSGTISLTLYTNLVFIPAVAFLVMPLIIGGLLCALLNIFCLSHICFLGANHILKTGFSLLYLLKKHHLLWYYPVVRPHPLQLEGYYILLYTICLALLGKKIKKRILYLGLICVCLPSMYIYGKNVISPQIKAQVLDVGQGQAILITTPHKRTLIDGGGIWDPSFDFGERILSPVLCYMHKPHLDKVFLTHGDIDHLGGLFFILKKFSINGFYFSGRWPKGNKGKRLRYILTKRNIPIHITREGDTIALGKNIYLEVLNPPRRGYYKKENNYSLVLRLIYHKKHKNISLILIPSDIEKKGIYHILNHDIKSQAIVVPHHGSKTSFVPELYIKSKPEVAIVSCGYKNRFNFPYYRLINFLKTKHVPLYGTYKDGCVSITWPMDSLNIKIKTYYEEGLK